MHLNNLTLNRVKQIRVCGSLQGSLGTISIRHVPLDKDLGPAGEISFVIHPLLTRKVKGK